MKMALNLGIELLAKALIFCCLFPLLQSLCIRATIRSMSVVVCPCHEEDRRHEEEETVPLMVVEITEATGIDPLPLNIGEE